MTDSNESTAEKGPANKWLILAAVMLGTFITPLDASIVNTVLPKITSYFETDISIVQWVPTAYLLTISCVLMLFGRMGDMFGYKKIFLYGVAGFTLASVLCGVSLSIGMLIAARTLQGLSASMIMAVGFGIVVSAFPPNERGKVIGIYAMSATAASSLGPTLGGIIAEYFSWRWLFFINLPIGIAAVAWGSKIIPQGRTVPGQRLDIIGAVTAAVLLLSLLLYANKGGSWGWSSPLPLSLLGIALLFGLLFLRTESRSAQPMLNLGLFRNRSFSLAVLSALLGIMAYYEVVFLAPFYLAFILHFSILKIGLVMVALFAIMVVMAPLSGTLSDRFGTRIFAVSGMCLVSLGLFFFSGLKETAGTFDIVWRLIVIGLGISLFQSPNNSTIMGNVPPRYLGIAGGVTAAVRNLGMVCGVAVAGAVLYAVAPVALSTDPGSFTPADIEEFLSGFRWALITGVGLASVAALTSFAARTKQKPKTSAITDSSSKTACIDREPAK